MCQADEYMTGEGSAASPSQSNVGRDALKRKIFRAIAGAIQFKEFGRHVPDPDDPSEPFFEMTGEEADRLERACSEAAAAAADVAVEECAQVLERLRDLGEDVTPGASVIVTDRDILIVELAEALRALKGSSEQRENLKRIVAPESPTGPMIKAARRVSLRVAELSPQEIENIYLLMTNAWLTQEGSEQ